MLETPEEIDRLQQLLDRSAAGAGPHLRSIITDSNRLGAVGVCDRLRGMRVLVVATVTADGRPLTGPVDGPRGAEFRQAMLDHYLPLQGPAFEAWLNEADPVGARITADTMFTYASSG